jgi:dolichyl-phosphate-mannose-protein mannosyltransferase
VAVAAPARAGHRGGISTGSHRPPRWPTFAAAGVVAILVLVSLAFAYKHGGVPQADDWSYVRSGLTLHRTGHFVLRGWGQMFLLGQLATAQPFVWIFGARPFSFEIYGAAAMAVWFACAFVLARRLVAPRRAFLLVLGVAVWPGMGLLTASFMTDAPSAGASLLCVVLGISALERRSRLRLVGALAAGMFAFVVREQLVVGLVAVAAGAFLIRGIPRRFRIEVAAGTAAVLIAGAVLDHFRHRMHGADVPPFGLGTLQLGHIPPSLVPCLFTVALAVAPLSAWNLFTLRARDLLDAGRLVGWALGLVALGYVTDWNLAVIPNVTLRNYVTQTGGFAGVEVGFATPIMSRELWNTIQVIAIVSAVVLAGELGARLRRVNRLVASARAGEVVPVVLALYSLLLVAFVVGLAFGGETQFDRYLFPLFFSAGLVLLRPSRHRSLALRGWLPRLPFVVAAVGSVVFLAAVQLNTTASTDARDGAVWQAAKKLVASGVPATQINAGLNWNGYWATTRTDRLTAAHVANTYAGQHWTRVFPHSSDCYVVTLTRVPARYTHWHLLGIYHGSGYGFARHRMKVFSYFRSSCSPATATTKYAPRPPVPPG